ncbi:MAG: caspase family protein [Planctomycetota bacterium]
MTRPSTFEGARRSLHELVVVALVACILPAFAAASRSDDGQGAPSKAHDRRMRALLVGCGEYPRLAEEAPDRYDAQIALRGPRHDVELMRSVLVGTLGFATNDVEVLVDEDATRESILAGLERLAGAARDGDRVVVYFAGHGCQQPARERDTLREPDLLDEVLLPADAGLFDRGSGSIPGAIRDDELGERLRAIRDAGAEVWLVVDACHSGSILRGEDDVRLRGLDPDVLSVPRVTSRFRERIGAPAPVDDVDFSGIVAFYAAQSYGRAPEFEVDVGDGTCPHGLFTWLLAQELVRTEGRVTYAQLVARVVAAYQAWPCTLTVPGAIGGDLDRPVLGLGGEVAPWQVQRLDGDRLGLDRGTLAGVEPGTRLALLADDGSDLTEFVVTTVDAFSAHGRASDPDRLAGASSWSARLVSSPLPSCRLPWSLVDAEGVALDVDVLPERVRETLLDEWHAPRLPLVAPDEAAWLLVSDRGEWRLRPRASEGGQDLLLDGVDGLVRDLSRIARTRNLVGLGSSAIGAPLPEGLEVWVEVRDDDRSSPRRLVAGETVPPGAKVRVQCRKRAGDVIDLNLFYADSHGGMTRLFPRSGGNPRLGADVEGVVTALDWTTVLDTSLGIEHVLAIAQARRPSERVLDLAELEQDGVSVHRGADDPVAALLTDVARATPTRGDWVVVPGSEPIGVQLVSLDVRWPAVARPAWPRTGVVDGDAGSSGRDGGAAVESWPDGVPAPAFGAARRALVRRPGARSGPADAVLGGGDEVEWVAVDPFSSAAVGSDPAESLASGAFAPLAVLRLDDDRRLAYYRASPDRPFATILEDADGDGLAETRYTRDGDGWRCDRRLAVPWLSQVWIGRLPDTATRRRTAESFAILAEPSR